jgi:protein-histidine pros-kinase
VIRPVSELSQHADKISVGNMELPEFKENTRDEIGVLGNSFNRMRRSLQYALKMLDE